MLQNLASCLFIWHFTPAIPSHLRADNSRKWWNLSGWSRLSEFLVGDWRGREVSVRERKYPEWILYSEERIWSVRQMCVFSGVRMSMKRETLCRRGKCNLKNGYFHHLFSAMYVKSADKGELNYRGMCRSIARALSSNSWSLRVCQKSIEDKQQKRYRGISKKTDRT